ncbi:Major facilitator superfamily domain-containing protein 6 [Araneus ventricosus]|uniref:Major facilitator superfamily domain-containing protein 6 n=1 Tax=Araneus ventricosus TaxID=182803 RepID=A0A4Y2CJC9_ARAVE|nr:Major facilitator superfamily domain-containing protein 6 [Araneus ventricosus]
MDVETEETRESFLPEAKDGLNCTVSVQPNSSKESQPVQKWWHIDKKMIRFKMHYFLLTGALGSVLPFIAVIVRNRIKLSATSFATVLVFEQFLFVFTKPAIGYITDYFNKLKVVLCIVAVGQGLFLFILLLLPAIPKGQTEIDNTMISNINIQDACSLCENFNSSTKDLKVFVNSTDDFGSTSWFRWSSLDDKTCHFFKEKSLNYSHYWFSNVAVPAQCQATNANISFTTEKKTIKLGTIDNEITSNQPYISTFECPRMPNDSCALMVYDCVLCCIAEEGCHYKVHPVIAKRLQTITSKKTDFETYQFWVFALVFTILNACINAIFTLSDTACCESVQKNGADYGKQRLWGAVGWGLLAPIGGVLTDYTGDYIAVWIVFAILSIFMIWNILKLNLVKPHFSKDILKNVGTIMKEKEFLCFELGVFVNGIGLGFIWFYLMWFVTSIGGTRLVCGLTQTVQCFVGELPFMFFSGWMLKKMGYFNILTISLLAYCVRFFWYSLLDNPWLILPIEWTHGITYGVFYTSIATYAKMRAKPGTETTTQSVIFATYDGLGAGFGNVFAGLGFDYLGAHETFFYTGIFFGCCSVVSTCYTLFNRKTKKKSETVEET